MGGSIDKRGGCSAHIRFFPFCSVVV
jgi:hypothetical protein